MPTRSLSNADQQTVDTDTMLKCGSVRGEGRHGNPSDCLAFFYAGADEQLDCCWTAGENSSIAPPLTGFVRLNEHGDV